MNGDGLRRLRRPPGGPDRRPRARRPDPRLADDGGARRARAPVRRSSSATSARRACPGLDRPEAIFQLVCDGPARPLPAARRAPAERRAAAARGPDAARARGRARRAARLRRLRLLRRRPADRDRRARGDRARRGSLAEARAIATQAGLTRPERARRRARAGIRLRDRAPALRAGARRRDERRARRASRRRRPRSRQPLFDDVAAHRRRRGRRPTCRSRCCTASTGSRRTSRSAGRLMIAIDDLHWADGPSLRWLAHLQRRLEGLPLLVVVATRPPDQSPNEARVTEILADPRRRSCGRRRSAATRSAHIARELFGARAATRSSSTRAGPRRAATRSSSQALLDTIKREGLEPSRRERRARRTRSARSRSPARSRSGCRASRRRRRCSSRAVAVLGGRAELRHAAALAGLERELASHAATTLARADLLRLRDAARVHASGRARRGVRRHVDRRARSPRTAARRRSSPTPAPSRSRSPCTSSSRCRTATRSSSRRFRRRRSAHCSAARATSPCRC